MKRHRILIVEDDAIMGKDIEERLTSLGYQAVGRAASGEQALELAGTQHPDLILIDISLPGNRDGIAIAREIRRRFHFPIIFLTDYSEDATLEQAKIAEPLDYLLKPFEDQELKSTIEIALYKHQAEEEICRLNRMFDVLSRVNQAVVHIRSREELLTVVCRLLVERGKADLAWIGWVDPATSHIKPVAQHGHHTEILTQADFYADGRPEGQGNPGKAVREGKAFICMTCPGEACLYPARKQPHRFGFRACGSFPLRLGGQVCAVLSICAAESKYFGNRETELLQEVARDISLALDKQDSEFRRDLAEAALRASEDKFRLAMEAAEEGIWDWDIPTGELYLSPGFMRVMGYEPEETVLNSQVWEEHVHPEDLPRVLKALQDHYGGRLPSYECEYRVRTKTGEYRWVRARGRVVSRQVDGKPQRIVGAVRDITERRLVEDKIKESEAKYRRIVETALEGIWVMDRGYRTTFVNQNMAGMLGYRSDEMLGKPVTDFMFPADLEEHEQKMARRRQGTGDTYERRFKRKDGTELWTLISATALMDEAGGFQGSFGMFTDITERRRMEEALRESEGRVRAKLDSILSPEGDIGQLEFEDIIDSRAIQSLMDDFYRLTRLPMSIIDLKGKVLVGIGWQEICTNFHRKNPKALKRCLASDLELSQGVPPGTFKLYKCKNNLRDIVTPIMVGGKHLGNLFMGQFFFDDDALDMGLFLKQAKEFGFDEADYLAALARVPCFSRQTIDQAMSFFSKLAHMISMLCHSNINLARSIAERDRLVEVLRDSQENMRANEQFLNDIFSSIQDGLGILDLERNIVRVNPAMQKFAQRLPMEGRKCHEVYLNRSTPCQNCPVESTLKTMEACQVLTEVKTDDGRSNFMEIFSYPLITSGQLTGIIEYVRDVTQVKKAEETFQEMERQLLQAKKMEAIGTLAGGIAHDFNNILWAIMGYAEMASFNLINPDMARQYLDQVLKASQRAKNLVGQILAFSRRLESERKPLYLKNVIFEAINLLRASLPATIEIRPRLLSDSPILADSNQMSQVIMNLATNAFHAMEHSGGVLSISLKDVKIVEPVKITQGELKPGGFVKLEVEDTGSGIDPAAMNRIFEPYFTTKEIGKGTGLGLATVLGIVENHNGKIDVASQPGQGTTFSLYFPIIDQRPDQPPLDVPLSLKKTGQILFIDDEPSLAELGKAALTRLGYNVMAFTDSKQALATFEAYSQEFDLVITDLTMPYLTGLDLAKRFQTLRPDMPIIMCTGYTELLKPKEVRLLGIKEVLSKPLRLNQLGETVNRALKDNYS